MGDLEVMGDRFADAAHFDEAGFGRGEHFREAAEAGEQRLGQRLGVGAPDDLEEDQLEQLVVGEARHRRRRETVPSGVRDGRHRRGNLAVGVSELPSCLGQAWRGGLSPLGDRVKISWPVSVTPTECSNCAESERSRVTAVQPSERIFTCGAAEIDHRLDGEDHAGLEHDPVAGRAVVEDVGHVVEQRGRRRGRRNRARRCSARARHSPGWRGRCRRSSRPAGSRRCRASSPRRSRSISRSAARLTSPTLYMRLESPCQPSRISGHVDVDDVAVAAAACRRGCRGRRRG